MRTGTLYFWKPNNAHRKASWQQNARKMSLEFNEVWTGVNQLDDTRRFIGELKKNKNEIHFVMKAVKQMF